MNLISNKASNEILQVVLLDETGDSYYRFRWPAETLARVNPGLRIVNLDARAAERYQRGKETDLLVLFNPADLDFIDVIAERKRLKKKTLIEFNDNFFDAPPWSPVYTAWSSFQIQNYYATFARYADHLMVTGPGMLELMRPYTHAPITIIENNLAQTPSSLRDALKAKKHGTIGWAGSLGHIADILSVLPTLEQTVRSASGRTLHVMGNEYLKDNARLNSDQYTFTAWGSIFDYQQFWRPLSIGVIPMLDTPYNRCRSDIKVLEMVAQGVLPIVPRRLPYQSLIERFTLLSFDSIADLAPLLDQALSLSTDDIEKRLQPLWDYIVQSRVEERNSARKELYRSLLPGPRVDEVSHPAGYFFEGSGKSSPQPSIETIKTLRTAFSNEIEKRSDVLRHLKTQLEQSPHHVEYAFCYLRLLSIVESKQAQKLIPEFIERFPFDIRLRVLKVELESPEHRIREWEQILNWYQQQSKSYQIATAPYIGSRLEFLLKNGVIDLVGVSARFLELHPYFHQLRLLISQAYERMGNDAQALMHFRRLREFREMVESQSKELSEMSLSFLSAWEQALENRVSRLGLQQTEHI
jgi:hypothetical protein